MKQNYGLFSALPCALSLKNYNEQRGYARESGTEAHRRQTAQ